MNAGALTIRQASPTDVAAITTLVNRAFEVEKFFAIGDRVSGPDIASRLVSGVIFVALLDDALVGCVYTERRAENRGYIGLLAVDPSQRGSGLGRRLMREAEEHCRQAHCTDVMITVVNLRTELPSYYGRLGYRERGTLPYPDPHRATQPCHFIVMTKPLGGDAG